MLIERHRGCHPLATVAIAVLALASSMYAAAGDPVAGKAKAAVCMSCHGRDGNSVYPAYPKLAGQLHGYILAQTSDFRDGARTDLIMSKMINVIPNDEDLDDVAAYFSSQPVMKGVPGDPEKVARGRRLYESQRCNFCHSEGGRPVERIEHPPPVIGGQHKEYLVKALKDIKRRERPADLYGLMPQILAGLSNDDIEAIADYLSSL